MPPRRRRFGYVRKLPSGRYQASYLDPSGARRTAPNTFAFKRDADEWLSVTEADMLRGQWRDPDRDRVTLQDFGERWITERPGLRPRTADLYRWLFAKYVAPDLGPVPLGDLTSARVRSWRAGLLNAGVSEGQAAKAYRLLRAILMTAADDDVIARNPCRIRGAGNEAAPERPVLSVEQVLRLADTVPSRYSVLILAATFGSLRWGEAVALRRQDIDLEGGRIIVRRAFSERSTGQIIEGPPKSRAGVRVVLLPRAIVDRLAAHLATTVGSEPDALVFAGDTGVPLRRSNFNRQCRWPQSVAAIGAPGLHFHDLRHTGNHLAAQSGASLRDLMLRMGHDSMRAALIYQHATQSGDERIAQALDGLLDLPPRDGTSPDTDEATER